MHFNLKMNFNVIKLLETAFERLGRFIARWPCLVIISCLLWTGLCCVGFINLTFNSSVDDIWDTNPSRSPAGSQSKANKEWVLDHFKDEKRAHTLIFSTTDPEGNILTPNALRIMLDVHKQISAPSYNVSFQDICFR